MEVLRAQATTCCFVAVLLAKTLKLPPYLTNKQPEWLWLWGLLKLERQRAECWIAGLLGSLGTLSYLSYLPYLPKVPLRTYGTGAGSQDVEGTLCAVAVVEAKMFRPDRSPQSVPLPLPQSPRHLTRYQAIQGIGRCNATKTPGFIAE